MIPVSEETYTAMDLVPVGMVNVGAAPPGARYFVSIPSTSALLPPLGLHGLKGNWPFARNGNAIKQMQMLNATLMKFSFIGMRKSART